MLANGSSKPFTTPESIVIRALKQSRTPVRKDQPKRVKSRVYNHKTFLKADPEGPVDRTGFATNSLYACAAACVLAALLLGVVSYSEFQSMLNSSSELPSTLNSSSELPSTPTYISTRKIVQIAVICVFAALFIGFSALSLIVVRGLRRRKRKAWRDAAALFVIFGATIIMLPLTITGLYGLLSEGTRTKFARSRRKSGQHQR